MLNGFFLFPVGFSLLFGHGCLRQDQRDSLSPMESVEPVESLEFQRLHQVWLKMMKSCIRSTVEFCMKFPTFPCTPLLPGYPVYIYLFYLLPLSGRKLVSLHLPLSMLLLLLLPHFYNMLTSPGRPHPSLMMLIIIIRKRFFHMYSRGAACLKHRSF